MARDTWRNRIGSSRYDRIAAKLRVDPTLSARQIAIDHHLLTKDGKPNTWRATRVKRELAAKRGVGDLIGPRRIKAGSRAPAAPRQKGEQRGDAEYLAEGPRRAKNNSWTVSIRIECDKEEHSNWDDWDGNTHPMYRTVDIEWPEIPSRELFDKLVEAKATEFVQDAMSEGSDSPPQSHHITSVNYALLSWRGGKRRYSERRPLWEALSGTDYQED